MERLSQKSLNTLAAMEREQRPTVICGEVIGTGVISEIQQFPLILEPTAKEIRLAAWAASSRGFVAKQLGHYGALLFRGFGIDCAGSLEEVARTLAAELVADNGEHVPVANSAGVQTPVFYAPEKKLLWHNENTFNARWPTRIFFSCGVPAASGGETPLVDTRKVFQGLPEEVRVPFLEKGVMYTRNYDGVLGLPWEKVFMTNDQEEAEDKGTKAGFQFDWKSGGRLETRCVRPAALPHPQTGEWCWCSQIQHWHPFCLDDVTRSFLVEEYGEHHLPRNCYYGDGTVIGDSTVKHILDTFQTLEVSFNWERGDLLVVDNLMVAHGRNPYSGARKIFVALADAIEIKASLP
jgi:Taurine catabolism dioxygenase TauD, TfdA family